MLGYFSAFTWQEGQIIIQGILSETVIMDVLKLSDNFWLTYTIKA